VISGFDTGPVPIRARAVDWSGNTGPETEDTWVYYDPPLPQIIIAGFEGTTATAGIPSTITVSAIVRDAWDPVYLKDAVVYFNGEPLNDQMAAISENGGYRYYQLVFDTTYDAPGAADVSIIVRDRYNNPSTQWPDIPVKW